MIITTITNKAVYLGIDIDSIAKLLDGHHLQLQADPERGLPLPVVLFYGRDTEALHKVLRKIGVRSPEIIEHDLKE